MQLHLGIYFGYPFGHYPTFYTLMSVGRKKSFQYVKIMLPLFRAVVGFCSTNRLFTKYFRRATYWTRPGHLINSKSKSKFLPQQWRIGRRLSPFPVALGHMSANAVKATAGGWSTGSSACLTFPLHSLMSSARREGSEYPF